MKKVRFILTVITILIHLNPYAQNVDSLYQIIELATVKDSSYFATLQNYLSANSLNYSEKDLALIQEAKKISIKKKDTAQIAKMLHFEGWYFYQKSQIDKSIFNYLEAIKLIEKKENSEQLLRYYTDLANSYNASNDFQKAIDINLKTIEIVKNDTSSMNKARYYFYTAKSYDRQKDFNEAQNYYYEAKRISEEANFPYGVVLSNSSLGHNYNELGEFEKALPLLKKSVKAFEANGHGLNLASAYSSIANTYFGLEDYEKSAFNYEKAISIYKEIKNTSYLKFNYNRLAFSYKMMNNSTEAYKNYDLALQYADTLYNQERLETIEKLKTEFETEKHKQEKLLAQSNELISTQKAESSRIVSISIGVFSILILGLLVFILNRMKLIRKQKVKLDEAYAQLEESKKNELAVSNLKALQSQMNPHFIFNALNSVQDLVLLQDIRSSNKYLGKFSDLIRKILLSSKEQFISLEEEVEILGLYLDLEKLRFGEEFQIDFSCQVSEEKQEDIQLPAMFIQPYIENAIKHGLFNKKGEKRLKVAFSLINESTLECIVEDNGVGQKQAAIMKQERLHLHTGFSTEAINERIRLLNQTLDKKIDIQIIDLEEKGKAMGTKIILHFPI